MKIATALTVASLTLATTATAATFESGDWGTARIGHACHVFTTRAARHTSGALVLTFYQNGYNASFGYNYQPWPGETEAPWGEDDYPVLALDDETSWLGDEMFKDEGAVGYGMYLTGGMLPDLITSVRKANRAVDAILERSSPNEVVVLGTFSPEGFEPALQKAGEWCAFDPNNLPSS